MKRIDNLFEKICSIENLELADKNARKGKGNQCGVKLHDRNRESNIFLLHEIMLIGNYKNSAYKTFTIFEPKERQIFMLPYFPDRICQHAIISIMEPLFVSWFTKDTYACIKGRGIHAAANAVKESLLDLQGTKYCLKLDIKKFYPSVDHDILKALLRRKIKDGRLLSLLYEIIDSADGIPIGNLLSQYFGNFYLTYFDIWIKQEKKVKHYFRYADDIVVLSDNKQHLHAILKDIKQYLLTHLKLEVKSNHQVFPVDVRGIDFVGYVFRHGYTRIRKSIKKNFARMLAKAPNEKSIASYYGWLCHANTQHLLKKLLHEPIQRPKSKTKRNISICRGQNKNIKAV